MYVLLYLVHCTKLSNSENFQTAEKHQLPTYQHQPPENINDFSKENNFEITGLTKSNKFIIPLLESTIQSN